MPNATHPERPHRTGGASSPDEASPGRTAVGVLALLAAAASIGAGAIAVRAAYDHGAESSSLVVVRFAVAGVLFAVLLPWLLARTPRPLPWRGLGFATLSGLALLAGARAEFEGLARLPAAVLVLLLFAAPIWVTLIEWIVWGRRVTPSTLASISLVIAGVATMVAPWTADLQLLGVAFGLAGSIALAGFFVLMEQSQATTPTRLAVSTALVVGGAVSILMNPGAVGHELGNPDVLPYALAVAAAFAGWGLLASIGLNVTGAVTATIVSAAEPVFVAVLAFLLLGESLSPREIFGGAIVMAGVLLASLGPTVGRREQPQARVPASSR